MRNMQGAIAKFDTYSVVNMLSVDFQLANFVSSEFAKPYFAILAVVDITNPSQGSWHNEFLELVGGGVELANLVSTFEPPFGEIDFTIRALPDRTREGQRVSKGKWQLVTEFQNAVFGNFTGTNIQTAEF